MARMFPNRIPKHIQDDARHGAECRVYERLSATLDDGYTVFGWVPWLCEEPGRGVHEGEADFVIAHETEGLLVLEIKGGGIRKEPDRWVSVDRHGREHVVQHPVLQARRSLDVVLGRLHELPGWRNRWIPAAAAVVLPDTCQPGRDFCLSAPLWMFAFSEHMGNLGPLLRLILRRSVRELRRQPGLGCEGVAALESFVAGSFDLPAPLGVVLHEEDREILRLTEDQYRVLDGLAGNPRVLVSGGAGTGKTMLAMEQARRLARQGRRTLLTCFNRPLADFLRQSTGSRDRVTIANFHQLCHRWARKAGVELPDPDGPEAAGLPESYFQRDLPRHFLDALDRLEEERFDSIVVDEGQDFLPDYWDALELSFADRIRGTLHVFLDASQDIYGAGAGSLHGMMSFALQENLRNTRQIHHAFRGFSPGDRTVSAGPAGERPEWIAAPCAEHGACVAAVVERLVRRDGVPASEIAVLTTSRGAIPLLAPDGRIGAVPVTRDPLERSDRVLVESIPRFKGLERRAIVLAGLRESRHVPVERMFYVGASRARTYLVTIADPDTIERVRAGAGDAGATAAG